MNEEKECEHFWFPYETLERKEEIGVYHMVTQVYCQKCCEVINI